MRVVAIGSGRSVHALSRSAAVAATGIEVRFVTVGPVLPIAGLEVRTRPLPTNPIAAVRAALGFLRDVRAFAPDLVHLHYAGGKLASLATSAHAHPLVATVMGGDVLPEQHQGGLSFWERRATRRVLQEADLLLAKSDALQAAIRSFAPTKARIETVRWGVDPARTQRDETGAAVWRARLGLAPDTPVILSPRTPHALYNIHLLIDAWPEVLKAAPKAVLLITESGADPAYLERIQARVRNLGLAQHVRFVGRVDPAEMTALYTLATAVAMIPSSDGLPQSLFEAWACRAPVILGRLPTYSEVATHNETAIMTDLTASAIADALVRLIQSPESRMRIASAARTRLRQLASLPDEARRVHGFYRELLERHDQRARPRRLGPRALDALSLWLR